jgi:glycosyltransferase involved in cell wall biosynthesis
MTIVICAYRYGHLAAHCIESVLSQSKQPEKILFVDDGAGDCKHLVTLYPQVEFVLREENKGIVDNFQDMLTRVKTEKVMLIGADNWLRSDAIETLENIDADVITYDIMVTGELKDEIKKRHPGEIIEENGDWYWDRKSGHHGSMVYNVKIALESGGYGHSGDSRSEEDRVLYWRMINNGAKRVHVPEPFLYYRRHKQNFYQ